MKIRHDDRATGAMKISRRRRKAAPQVLVVDDSSDVRRFVATLLRLSGYRVLEAVNGVDAQQLLESEHPALVISDLEMPVCDGWEVLAYCHRRHPDLPVLILSGSGFGRRPEVESLAAGFLAKPFELARFHDAVERLICRAA